LSLDPALVSVCIGRGSRAWPPLRQAPRIGVSIPLVFHASQFRRLQY
jgi:flavin reductase (DIM6/NTAB) family NADH-FMN oxidoreductase RutF